MIRKRLSQVKYQICSGCLVFLFLLGNSNFVSSGFAYSTEKIPLQSVSMWEFSTQITFEDSISTIIEQGSLVDQNVSILLVVETDESILGIMFLYLTSLSESVWYSVGNPEKQSPLWANGMESVHFQYLDSVSIECNFLELSPSLNGNYLRSKVLAFYTTGSPDEIKQNLGYILSNEEEEFSIANYIWASETTSTTDTTTSENPDDDSTDDTTDDTTDDVSDDASTPFQIPGYYSIFVIGALSVVILLSSVNKKNVKS